MCGFIWGGVRGFIWEGHAWFYSGGMRGFIQGGHAWFYSGGACMVLLRGVCGFIRGVCVVLFGGVCVVLFGGHAWFFQFFRIQ